SPGYPPLQDTFRCITHPFATRRQGCPRAAVRLACVRHAASVQSEPGSNSSVQCLLLFSVPQFPAKNRSLTQRTDSWISPEMTPPEDPSILCETLDTFAIRQVRKPVARRHQAPTLIGCELLKIASRPGRPDRPVPLTRHHLFRVRRSLQQRSEIIQA